MSSKNLTSKVMNNWMFVLEFMFFLYIFHTIPYVADRWMEPITYYKLESFWRFIFVQYRWLTNTNGRIFSNIFCGLVDPNTYVRSIVNACMITGISFIMCKIASDKPKMNTKVLSVLLVLIVSEGIKEEVYYYATTLYISTILIAILIIYFYKTNVQNRYINLIRMVLVTIGSLWIENLSIGIFVGLVLLLIKNLIYKEKFSGNILLQFFLSTLGFMTMLFSSALSSSGRLSNREISSIVLSKNVFNGIIIVLDNIFFKNINILIVLTIVLIVYFYLNTNSKIFKLTLFSIMLVLFSMISFEIYKIVKVDPTDIDYVSLVTGWRNFDNIHIDKAFALIYYLFIPIISFFYFLVIVRILLLKNKKEKVIYDHTIFAFSFFIFSYIICILGVGNGGVGSGERIMSLSIFIMMLLVIAINEKIELNFLNKNQEIIFLIAIILINMNQYNFDVRSLDTIDKERSFIASEVKKSQSLGEWDFSKIVNMPRYNEKEGEIFGGRRANPILTDIYYPLLLKYYGLDEDTVLAFNNEPISLKYDLNNNDVEIYLDNKNFANNFKYKYVVYEIGENSNLWEGELLFETNTINENNVTIEIDDIKPGQYIVVGYIYKDESIEKIYSPYVLQVNQDLSKNVIMQGVCIPVIS